MNLKFLILCITAVAATSNKHHLRQEPGQHDISFRATKGRLRRLLNDNEVAPNRHLEALRVLRGSQRSLKDRTIDCEERNIPQNRWTCNRDTEKCGRRQDECKEVCDENKDCHGHGDCDKGKCKCEDGYEDDKDCGRRDVEFEFTVHLAPGEVRTTRCINALQNLQRTIDGLSLPTTMTVDSRSRGSRRSSNRSDRGAAVLRIPITPNPDCTLDGLADQALRQAEFLTSGRLNL